MARVATDHVTVLDAVVARLIASVRKFTDKNCYLTAEPPDNPTVARNDIFCTVSPTDGRFDDGVHEGGGIDGTFEYAGVMVSVFNVVQLDQVGHDAALLTIKGRGLLVLKKEILDALSGHDLANTGGDNILVNVMAPLNSLAPRSIKGEQKKFTGDIALVFSTDFQWSLTAI